MLSNGEEFKNVSWVSKLRLLRQKELKEINFVVSIRENISITKSPRFEMSNSFKNQKNRVFPF